jgi:DNA polymerase-3 subunit gamma/tau
MNKNIKVLALKYRPQTFQDLIGQDMIGETILNSIKADKIPNAYIFTGIRGTGKTSTARIIAKTLNCLNGIENICKEKMCESCNSITESNHIDVLEMDAASNTGVDSVRELIEFSRYGPTTAKYKIFIVDEVHMLSKQAFNALLKTLEEPPTYLKFIFATTEIKKIPITVVSRCQRFNLSRVKSIKLFEYIKKIKDEENGKVTDDALKLIVKISEGSVRDALSLLDRALISSVDNQEINLTEAQRLFGYFDKSKLIELIKLVFEGEEKKVLDLYRLMHDQGVDPKNFINDFLEILYYFKNIDTLKVEGTNFSLNDNDFSAISKVVSEINDNILLLFWQFTIKTLSELDIVSNQNLSIEMFLIRLMHLKNSSRRSEISDNNEDKINNSSSSSDLSELKNIPKENNDLFNLNNKTIGQIKNVIQEKKIDQNINKDKELSEVKVSSFNDLLKICSLKKEMKLKYELEKNVNLVSFENQRIEISFNDDLDKEFIKNLSSKLFEWTRHRWIITLSKEKGQPTQKEKEKKEKLELFEKTKNTEVYKKILEKFPDAELEGVEVSKNYD